LNATEGTDLIEAPPNTPKQWVRKYRSLNHDLEALSEANRATVEAHALVCLNRMTVGTVSIRVRALRRLDAVLGGRPLATVTGHDLARFATEIRTTSSASNLSALVAHMKPALKELLGLEPDERLPTELARPLRVRLPRHRRDDVLVREEDFNALLAAANQNPRNRAFHWGEQVQAFLWFLWATGFRIDEALSCNLRAITLDHEGGAWVRLSPDAPLKGEGTLKTGAREVYITEGIKPLQVWVTLHPGAADPAAPLWVAPKPRQVTRLEYSTVTKHWLPTLVRRAGLLEKRGSDFAITPHDFRHTCATRKARLGWNEAQLCAYFGWAPGSRQASHYVHLAAADMRERVRKDAGLAADSHPVVAVDVDVAQRLAQALTGLLAGTRPKGQVAPPPDWQRP
jgi:integrase